MFPQFEFFGKTVGMYALLAIIGALLSGFLFCRLIRRHGLDDNPAMIFLGFVAVGVMLGGHILFGLTHIRYFPLLLEKIGSSVWLGRFSAIFGGSVFYGGLIGGLMAGYITIHHMCLDRAVYEDCMAPVIPLFHGIARIGCFLGGCCYGVESGWGFTAHGNPYVSDINDISRFPVQLLEAGCNFMLAGVLLWLLKRRVLRGRLLIIYLMSYACIRFADEFLRGDSIRGGIGIFSTSQWISIGFLILCGVTLTVLKYKKKVKISSVS